MCFCTTAPPVNIDALNGFCADVDALASPATDIVNFFKNILKLEL